MSQDQSPLIAAKQHTISTAKFSANGSSSRIANTTSFEVSYMEEIQNLIEQIDKEMNNLKKQNTNDSFQTFNGQDQKKKTIENIRFEKNDCLAKIIQFKEQMNQSRDQIEMVRQDIQSKHFQNYELIIETDELEQVLNSYKNQRPEEADFLKKEVQLEFQLEDEYEFQHNEKSNLTKLEKKRKQIDLSIDKLQIQQEQVKQQYNGIQNEYHGLQTSETQTKIYELLEFDGYTLWTSILRIFNIENSYKNEQLENTEQIQQIQQILIKEVKLIREGEYNNQIKTQLQDQKKNILFSQSNQLLMSLSMSFDQIIYNIQYFLKNKNQETQDEILELIIMQLQELNQNYEMQLSWNQKIIKIQKMQKQYSQELSELKQEQQQINEEISKTTLNIQQAKKLIQSIQTQQKKLRDQVDVKMNEDCDKMTQMYLQDKEQQLRDVRFKYGKAYLERMINDLKKEFRQICQKQQQEMHDKLKYILKRIWQIERITQQNKGYIEMLESDLEQFKNSLRHQIVPMAIKQLNAQLQHLDEQEQLSYQKSAGSLSGQKSEQLLRDKYCNLQNLKICLLQMENKMHKQKQMNVSELQDIKQRLRQIKKEESLIQKQAIIEQSKEISLSIQNESSQLKDTKKKDMKKNKKNLSLYNAKSGGHCKSQHKSFRSPSAQISIIQSSNQSPHNRSCSIHHVPQISIELLNENSIQVNNPRELLDSLEFQNQQIIEPSQTVKKQNLSNNYQISFNNNLSDSYMIQQQSCITNSVLDMFEDNLSQQKCSQKQFSVQNQECILAYFRKGGVLYDPIKNSQAHPQDFGFTLYKVIQINNKIQFYCGGQNQENLDQIQLEIIKEDIKQFKLQLCTENAIRFLNIYNKGSKRIPCQDSVALSHLKIQYFPFTIIGKENNILEGLATSEQDLENLSKIFI